MDNTNNSTASEPKKFSMVVSAVAFALIVGAFFFNMIPAANDPMIDQIIGYGFIVAAGAAYYSLSKADWDGRILYYLTAATSGGLLVAFWPVSFVLRKLGGAMPSVVFTSFMIWIGRPFLALLDGFCGIAGKWSGSPILKGDLDEIWKRNNIDPATRPELHNTEIPADIRRKPWRDGRTVVPESMATLFDHRVSRDTVAARLGIGVVVAVAVFITSLFVAPMLGITSPTVADVTLPNDFYTTPTMPGMVSELTVSGFTVQAYEVFFSVWGMMRNAFSGSAWVLFSISAGAIATALSWRSFYTWERSRYAIETRDVPAASRRGTSIQVADIAYVESINLALGYEKDAPLMKMGVATGLMSSRGDITAPQAGQDFMIDLPALFLNTLILGATGSGKSTYALPTIAKFVLGRGASAGAIIMDDKAVLYGQVQKWMENLNRSDDVRIVGPEEDMFHVDLLDALEPAEVMTLVSAIVAQSGSGSTSGDPFWQASAIQLMRATLFVAKAYECLPEGQAFMERESVRIYSLGWVYKALTQKDFLSKAVQAVLGVYADQDHALLDRFDSDLTQGALKYVTNDFLMAGSDNKTVESVRKTAESYMSSLCEEPAMHRFAWGATGNKISVNAALEGKVVCLALSQLRYGMGAKLAAMLIKSSYYRAARLREQDHGSKFCQENPSLCMIDEAQALITLGGSGIDDQSFFNVNRSAGVIGVLATQSISSLLSGAGGGVNNRDHIDNLLNNMRNKILLAVEDKASLDMAQQLAGRQPRSTHGQGYASVEERIQLAKFEPLWPAEVPAKWSTPIFAANEMGFLRTMLLMNIKNHSFSRPSVVASRDAAFESQLGVSYGSYANIMGIDPVFHSEYNEEIIHSGSEGYRDVSGKHEARTMKDGYGSDIDFVDVLTPYDIETMGRNFAFIFTQRAGLLRFDMVQIKHDFS